jgi:DNA transformation protein and related proteins
MSPVTYETTDGQNTLFTYWRCPDRLFDDSEAMIEWARRAIEISRAGILTKSKRAKKATP